MKVSVVIPAHNEEKYIANTLEMILKQDHPDFEVIVICNACTDRTGNIARGFPVKVVEESRKGSQWARECGRKEAKGEIVATLDADCEPDQDWLSKGQDYFKDRAVAAVSGSYDYYDTPVVLNNFLLFLQNYIYRYTNNFLNYFRIGGVLIHGNCMIRSAVLEKMGGFDTSILFYGDDTDTAKRASAFGKIIFSKNLTMKTSGRRFAKHGMLKTLFLYFYYFIKTTFFGKVLKR